ncbi:TPT-domain-containing protein, partial [Martensiomyces pterosporus]
NDQQAAALSILVYLALSLGLTLHNKIVLQWHKFGFPWLVTAVHSLGGVIGMRFMVASGRFTPVKLVPRKRRLLWAFSVLYTVNIAVSNISLHYVTIPFHQVVRGTVPVFTVLMSIVLGSRGYSRSTYLSLVPVVVGVGMATYGDYSFTVVGFLLTLLGTVLAAAKTVVTNTILVGGNRLELSAFDLLYQLSPLALVQTLAWSVATGEFSRVVEFTRSLEATERGGAALVGALLVNGSIAFVLNIASFTANKKTGPLAMTVTGNIKVVLTVVLGCVLFNTSLAPLSMVGTATTLAGGALYSAVRLHEHAAAS